MTELGCEHDCETDFSEATSDGILVRWHCAEGYQHEEMVSEL